MQARTFSIAAFCNPLMDMIAHVSREFIEATGAAAGSMNLCEFEKADGILSRLRQEKNEIRLLPGGSGANTARGFAWLNRDAGHRPPIFFGAVGEDERGNEYVAKLKAAGVESGCVKKSEPTGFSVIAVTPDGERTMFTFLGACRLFGEADVDFSLVERSAVLHLTGYMWDTENQKRVAYRAAEAARRAGAVVSLDLADPFVVDRYHDDFTAWIPKQVDLLFGNRDEFALLTRERESDEAIQAKAATYAPTIVMKAGAQGAYLGENGRVQLVPGLSARAIDTTGAGDSFAGGFLYAFLKGAGREACVRLANRLAASIVAVEGCDYQKLSYSGF